jgi:hypothetical protein
MLDIAVEQGSKRRRLHFRAWRFFVEPKKKSLRSLPCLGLRRKQIAISKDYTLPFTLSLRVRVVITELPHIRSAFALPQPRTSVLIPCPN